MRCFRSLLKKVLRGIPSIRAASALLPLDARKACSSVSRSANSLRSSRLNRTALAATGSGFEGGSSIEFELAATDLDGFVFGV